MRDWLEKVSEKYKGSREPKAAISNMDAQIIDVLLDVLKLMGAYAYDVSREMDEYKQSPDTDVLGGLLALRNKLLEGKDRAHMININGTTLPIKQVLTIKEIEEYDYTLSGMKYYLMLNEQDSAHVNQYHNIKIHFQSIEQREKCLKSIEDTMTEYRYKFIKI